MSESLKRETQRVLDFGGSIEVIHNFFVPRPPRRSAEEVRRELGLGGKSSWSTPPISARASASISCWRACPASARATPSSSSCSRENRSRRSSSDVRRLGLADRVIVREKVNDIEEYLQVADIGLFTSDTESFCLSILEAMCFGCPSVSTRVGGIPEVVEDNVSGVLVPAGDVGALARRWRP